MKGIVLALGQQGRFLADLLQQGVGLDRGSVRQIGAIAAGIVDQVVDHGQHVAGAAHDDAAMARTLAAA
ncbi:hypothetical protein ABTD43_19855, partial [Acinetobacter baumannii]